MANNQNNQRSTLNPMAVVVGAAAAGIGLYFLAKSLSNAHEEHSHSDQASEPKVQVVNTGDECRQTVAKLMRNCKRYPVVGFDCECVLDVNTNTQKAVLLQLSDHTGYCALIRLCKLNYIPDVLQTLLEDSRILKVGLSPELDAQKLRTGYNLHVNGFIDLRYVSRTAGYVTEAGLAEMAKKNINVVMDTSVSRARSKWDAPELSARQVNYAAGDVTVAMDLFRFFQNGIDDEEWFEALSKYKNVVFSRQ